MNLADEITINQIKQELISQEDAKNWFLSFPTEYQQEILQRLSYMTLQAGAREEDVSLAITKSKLRATYTPCVLLSKGRLKEQMAAFETAVLRIYQSLFSVNQFISNCRCTQVLQILSRWL